MQKFFVIAAIAFVAAVLLVGSIQAGDPCQGCYFAGLTASNAIHLVEVTSEGQTSQMGTMSVQYNADQQIESFDVVEGSTWAAVNDTGNGSRFMLRWPVETLARTTAESPPIASGGGYWSISGMKSGFLGGVMASVYYDADYVVRWEENGTNATEVVGFQHTPGDFKITSEGLLITNESDGFRLYQVVSATEVQEVQASWISDLQGGGKMFEVAFDEWIAIRGDRAVVVSYANGVISKGETFSLGGQVVEIHRLGDGFVTYLVAGADSFVRVFDAGWNMLETLAVPASYVAPMATNGVDLIAYCDTDLVIVDSNLEEVARHTLVNNQGTSSECKGVRWGEGFLVEPEPDPTPTPDPTPDPEDFNLYLPLVTNGS